MNKVLGDIKAVIENVRLKKAERIDKIIDIYRKLDKNLQLETIEQIAQMLKEIDNFKYVPYNIWDDIIVEDEVLDDGALDDSALDDDELDDSSWHDYITYTDDSNVFVSLFIRSHFEVQCQKFEQVIEFILNNTEHFNKNIFDELFAFIDAEVLRENFEFFMDKIISLDNKNKEIITQILIKGFNKLDLSFDKFKSNIFIRKMDDYLKSNGINNTGERILLIYGNVDESKRNIILDEFMSLFTGEENLNQDQINQFFLTCIDMMEKCSNDIDPKLIDSILPLLANVFNKLDLEYSQSKCDMFIKFILEDKKIKGIKIHKKILSIYENLEQERKALFLDRFIDLGFEEYLDSILKLLPSIEDNGKIQILKQIIHKLPEIREKYDRVYNIVKSLLVENCLDNEEIIQEIRSTDIGEDKVEFYGKLFCQSDNENRNKILEKIIEWMKEDGLDEKLGLSDTKSYVNYLFFSYFDLSRWDEDGISLDTKEYIIEYVYEYLKEEQENGLLNIQIYDFLETMRSKYFQNLKDLMELYEELKRKIIISDNMQEFDELLEKTGEIPEDRINEFLENIKLFKIKNDKLPKKYYDFIIKQLVLGKIDINEPTVFMALEELGKDYLSEFGFDDYPITAISSKKIDTYGVKLGEFFPLENKIFLYKDFIKFYGVGSAINVIFHECTHVRQHKKMTDLDLYDVQVYEMIKEEIIDKIQKSFYRTNYYYMEIEFDARMHGVMEMYRYLLSIGCSIKDIVKQEYYFLVSEIKEGLTHDRRFKKIDEKDNEESDNLEERHVDDIFLEIINSKSGGIDPFILTIFEEYPILKREFEISAEGIFVRKSREQLQAELIQLLSETSDENKREEIQEFYKHILKDKKTKVYEVNRDNCIQFLKDNGYKIDDSIIELLDFEIGMFGLGEDDSTTAIEDIDLSGNDENLVCIAHSFFKKHNSITRYIMANTIQQIIARKRISRVDTDRKKDKSK